MQETIKLKNIINELVWKLVDDCSENLVEYM